MHALITAATTIDELSPHVGSPRVSNRAELNGEPGHPVLHLLELELQLLVLYPLKLVLVGVAADLNPGERQCQEPPVPQVEHQPDVAHSDLQLAAEPPVAAGPLEHAAAVQPVAVPHAAEPFDAAGSAAEQQSAAAVEPFDAGPSVVGPNVAGPFVAGPFAAGLHDAGLRIAALRHGHCH